MKTSGLIIRNALRLFLLILLFALTSLVLSSCGTWEPAFSAGKTIYEFVGTSTARALTPSTIEPTSIQTITPTPTLTFTPSLTRTPTNTSTPTNTPAPVILVTSTPTSTDTPEPTRILATPVLLVGAGDISICGHDGDDETAILIESIPAKLFTAGDNSNEDGAPYQYRDCFGPTWGRFKDRMHPSIGNHDYGYDDGASYFKYFGDRAGQAGKGYYSYDLGDWHIIVLNSNCSFVDCSRGSKQEKWLRADLAKHANRCTLAYWHHPLFSSGPDGKNKRTVPFWRALYDAGVDVVVNGDSHFYERYAPQTPEGDRDYENGIQQFIVGTGGAKLVDFGNILPNSQARDNSTFGVIQFTLWPDSYEWLFIPTEPGGYSDSGSAACH